jgi:hypothetical protein
MSYLSSSCNITTNNIVQSTGSINITGNSNTIGSLFTTSANVGINQTSPSTNLHIVDRTANNTNAASIFIDKNNVRSSIQNWNYNGKRIPI